MVTHLVRPLAAVLLGFSLLLQHSIVSADSIPYPATLSFRALARINVNWWGREGGFISETAACLRTLQDLGGATYTHFDRRGGSILGDCWYLDSDGNAFREAQDNFGGDGGWLRDSACPKGGLPDDRGAARPLCVCPAGYNFPPPPVNTVSGPWCVQGGPSSGCPVSDIAPYGPPDPYPLDTANLTGPTMEAVNCLSGCAGTPVGTDLLASGYRPLDYQQHFTDVWDKWGELKDNTDPLCATLKAKIRNEFFTRHSLGNPDDPSDLGIRPPSGANCHSSGTCFDVRRAQVPNVDRCSSPPFICRLDRPYRDRGDPGHTVPY